MEEIKRKNEEQIAILRHCIAEIRQQINSLEVEGMVLRSIRRKILDCKHADVKNAPSFDKSSDTPEQPASEVPLQLEVNQLSKQLKINECQEEELDSDADDNSAKK